MTAVNALVSAYHRMANVGEVPIIGYSRERIGFVIPLDVDGSLAGNVIDMRQTTAVGKKMVLMTPLIAVPQPPRRTSGIDPCILWDKTSYSLGVSAKQDKRLAQVHAAWRALHLEKLADVTDAGLLALRRFVEAWRPEHFAELGWPEDMLDQNVVFALETERLDRYIHDRPAARALVARLLADSEAIEAICLVDGQRSPVRRLHPVIKGIPGAQSSGASLISFNAAAFGSYSRDKGANAPVSDADAAAYTIALNRMLERGSRQRVQIGDVTTVFWADASDATAAAEAENVAHYMFDGTSPVDEVAEVSKARTILQHLAAGRAIKEAAPELTEGVRLYILGLSPNAARLSVRYWFDDDFTVFAARIARHAQAMAIKPPPLGNDLSIWRCLLETTPRMKAEDIQDGLEADWQRAILTGGRYPHSLLTQILRRLRADGRINGVRVAMLKAVLITNNDEVPVSLDPTNTEPGYLLGRLFAIYESIQAAALGPGVNATIRDKYYSSASATPRAVYSVLNRMSASHLTKVRKNNPGLEYFFSRQIAELMALADPATLFPSSLPIAQQALFAIGYYHQRFDRSRPTGAEIETNGEGK